MKKLINWSWGKVPDYKEAELVTCPACKGAGEVWMRVW